MSGKESSLALASPCSVISDVVDGSFSVFKGLISWGLPSRCEGAPYSEVEGEHPKLKRRGRFRAPHVTFLRNFWTISESYLNFTSVSKD